MTSVRSLLLALLFCCAGVQAAPITGSVVDRVTGEGVAGVAIRALLSGTVWQVPETSAADGSFSFDLADGFTTQALDTQFLNLEFIRSGYRKATRMRRAQTRGVFMIDDLRVRLERLAEQQEATAAVVPAAAPDTPRRIFHGDYELFGEAGDETSGSLATLNRRLPRHLRRGIITHLQQLQLPANIVLDPVPVELTQADSIKLRAFAQSNDALGVILGEAELTVSDGGESIELASEYRIIPLLPSFQPGTLYVDDSIPTADFRPSRLSRSLSKTWGGTTVFALALYETRAALQQSDPQKRRAGLSRAESFLRAQRGSLGSNDILNQQIDDLLALIARERQS